MSPTQNTRNGTRCNEGQFECSYESDDDGKPFSESEPGDDESCRMCQQDKVSHKRANCFPIALLLLMSIVVQITPSTGSKCSNAKDIEYKNPKTGKLITCSLCPECPQSQEYSIPCGSTVAIGTGMGSCQDCKPGTFSSQFDKKPCQTCQTCTNRVYLRNCTKDHDALCGGCIQGYRYDNHTFDCIQIITQQTPTVIHSTSKPATITPKMRTSTHINKSKVYSKPTEISTLPHTLISEGTITPTPNYNSNTKPLHNMTKLSSVSPTNAEVKGLEHSTINPWMIALVVTTCVLAVIIGFLIKTRKRSRPSEYDEENGIPLSCGKSTILSEYLKKALGRKKFGEICHRINAKTKNLFLALVCSLGIDTLESYIFYCQGKGNFNDVLEKLVTLKPELTLEDIARQCSKNRLNKEAKLIREEDREFQMIEDESNSNQ